MGREALKESQCWKWWLPEASFQGQPLLINMIVFIIVALCIGFSLCFLREHVEDLFRSVSDVLEELLLCRWRILYICQAFVPWLFSACLETAFSFFFFFKSVFPPHFGDPDIQVWFARFCWRVSLFLFCLKVWTSFVLGLNFLGWLLNLLCLLLCCEEYRCYF